MIIFEGCDAFENKIKTIEVNVGGTIWDLHNSCEFSKLEYKVAERCLSLIWNCYDYSTEMIIGEVALTNINVLCFNIIPHDIEMPFDEDLCIESLVCSNEQNNMVYNFMGGMLIDVTCNKVKATYSKTITHQTSTTKSNNK